jgi:hypothetical protein
MVLSIILPSLYFTNCHYLTLQSGLLTVSLNAPWKNTWATEIVTRNVLYFLSTESDQLFDYHILLMFRYSNCVWENVLLSMFFIIYLVLWLILQSSMIVILLCCYYRWVQTEGQSKHKYYIISKFSGTFLDPIQGLSSGFIEKFLCKRWKGTYYIMCWNYNTSQFTVIRCWGLF